MHINKINRQKEWGKGFLLQQRGVVLYSFKTTFMRILGLILCIEDWKLNSGMVQLYVCAHIYTCEGMYMYIWCVFAHLILITVIWVERCYSLHLTKKK